MSPVRQIRQPRREDAGLPAAARHGAGRSLHPMDKKGPAIEVRGRDRIALSLQNIDQPVKPFTKKAFYCRCLSVF